MPMMALIAAGVVVAFMGLFAVIFLWKLANGEIDLRYLISEKHAKVMKDNNGDALPPPASLSRLQFLVFTYVVAMGMLVITLEGGSFPDISPEILGLLGISGGTYAVSKGIQKAKDGQGDQ